MRLSIRQYGLIASSALVLFSSAVLLLRARLEQDPAREDLFCRFFFVCVDNLQVDQAFRSLGQGGAGIAKSVEGFKIALRRDEASPFRWCDLGEAYLAAGDLSKARYCFLRGLQLDPHSPAIQLRVLNFYLRSGDPQSAITYMARLLKDVPSYDDIIFSYYDRMNVSVPEILEHGMPLDRRAASAWFQHLIKAGNLTNMERAWSWITAHSLTGDVQAASYIDLLLKQRLYASAAHEWAAYLAGRADGPLTGNQLLNGGFEEQPTGLAFDWDIQYSPHAQAARDCKIAHAGKCSLRIQFDAKENLDYHNVSQTIVIKPGRYRFNAYVRAEDITTDQGVQFHVFDIENPSRLSIFTEAVTGTTGWKDLRQTFTVPAETRVIRVQVFRSLSLKFENRIKGAVWIDQVTIVPAPL